VLDAEPENVLSGSAVAAFESKYLDVSKQLPWDQQRQCIGRRRTPTDMDRTTTEDIAVGGGWVGRAVIGTDLVNDHGSWCFEFSSMPGFLQWRMKIPIYLYWVRRIHL